MALRNDLARLIEAAKSLKTGQSTSTASGVSDSDFAELDKAAKQASKALAAVRCGTSGAKIRNTAA